MLNCSSEKVRIRCDRAHQVLEFILINFKVVKMEKKHWTYLVFISNFGNSNCDLVLW